MVMALCIHPMMLVCLYAYCYFTRANLCFLNFFGSPHGIFHLSDPSGVAVIRNCQQRGFHPHEESEDGNPIYEHCSHVFMNHNLKCDVVDLR